MLIGLDDIIYLAGSAVLLAMYITRKRRLSRFSRESFPELDGPTFSELRDLLESSCERLLFLGVGLLVLASISICGMNPGLEAFFLVVVFALFFASVAPRHRLLKKLLSNGIDLQRIRQAGVKL